MRHHLSKVMPSIIAIFLQQAAAHGPAGLLFRLSLLARSRQPILEGPSCF
jgi:hypothetical protein